MQSFTEIEIKVDSEEVAHSIEEHKEDQNPQLKKSDSLQKQPPPQQKVLKTECGHMFHENCLNEWLKIKAECPSCRHTVLDFI